MMAKLIDKTYNPNELEDRLYKKWMDHRYFHAEVNSRKIPYTIVIPPPNITGQLHMGHAMDNTWQDILIRMKRMQGFEALWLPGTDHASIATEAKLVEALKKEGISKKDLGREKFLEKAWEWKKVYGSRIVEQLKKLGSSCDWERERFTMDEGLSKAVTTVFIKLYNDGLIYRSNRIINWCPTCKTSISNAEVEYDEKNGHFWHMKYPVKDSEEYIVVATTRPETMLGDSAVAVNPEDERYSHMIGKTVILPLLDREIPIIADSYVDKDFGTGAVKITPAHDPNDFMIGLRHQLEEINVMNEDATMNENAGQYEGLDRYEARKKIISDLDQLGLLVKIEEHKHNVGACYRCDTIIEPMASLQWFVKMEPLAKPAIDVVNEGKVTFVPERFTKTYFNWMENIQDWCISRQLWWGHRIPAYYCQDCQHIMVADTKPDTCEKCGSSHLIQDEDTLDTWFSSALWPFSTLGWPEETDELKYFFPTDVLVTGYDIIFFWVARMIFSSMEHMKQAPFKYVAMHGLVRDADGLKMSKSLGNGIDPLDVIKEYGTDALRFALIIGNSPGNDLRFSEQKLLSSRNFANKIWNATRFVLMNFDEEVSFKSIDKDKFTNADKWILTKANHLITEVTDNIDKFEFGMALHKIYEFIWEDFCDWYIELIKPRLYDKDNDSRIEAQFVLNEVLSISMKLLHPFMPFITEEIYMSLINDDESIMISSWPEADEKLVFTQEEKDMTFIMEIIKSIRNTRSTMEVKPSRKTKLVFAAEDTAIVDLIEKSAPYFEKLAYSSGLSILKEGEATPDSSISLIFDKATVYIPMKDLIDIEAELLRLQNEKKRLEGEVKRASGKLSNENFISKAPESVVNEEKEKLQKYQEMLDSILQRLAEISG
ncbi:MAG: valine--tRNA ligase [Clostridia bacterium]|nr:valine--tRNA ligase [Clostridia bacterium]